MKKQLIFPLLLSVLLFACSHHDKKKAEQALGDAAEKVEKAGEEATKAANKAVSKSASAAMDKLSQLLKELKTKQQEAKKGNKAAALQATEVAKQVNDAIALLDKESDQLPPDAQKQLSALKEEAQNLMKK